MKIMEQTRRNLNIPLATAVLEQITRDPSSHDQRHWAYKEIVLKRHSFDEACQTRACVAGWTVLLDPNVDTAWSRGDELKIDGEDVWTAGIPTVAQHSLGLHMADAEELFLGSVSHRKTVRRLRSIIRQAKRTQKRMARADRDFIAAVKAISVPITDDDIHSTVDFPLPLQTAPKKETIDA